MTRISPRGALVAYLHGPLSRRFLLRSRLLVYQLLQQSTLFLSAGDLTSPLWGHKLRLHAVGIESLLENRQKLVSRLLLSRYLRTRVPLQSCDSWIAHVLPELSDDHFRHHTRMSRQNVGRVVALLEKRGRDVFAPCRRVRQARVAVQLHLFLASLGFYGNGAAFEQVRSRYGLSVGLITKARERVVRVLFSMLGAIIRWPRPSERKTLCESVRVSHGYHSVFYLVDGTTHPLAFTPSFDKESFFDRKSRYSMSAMVTCDTNKRVIHLIVGVVPVTGGSVSPRVRPKCTYDPASSIGNVVS